MILVTGGTGHIGNVLVRELLSMGRQVRVMVLPGENRRALDGLNVEVVEGDVLQPETLARAFEGMEQVYHLAGIISILPGRNQFVHRVNVEGTRDVLAAARKAGVRRLVYTSSIHALQRAPHGQVIDESVPFDPHNTLAEYDRSKAEASLAVRAAVEDGLDAVIVCPTGVIGPYDFRLSEMGSLILNGIRKTVQLVINGAYDFVDVRDVAKGEILAAEKGKPGEFYILSGEQITLKQMLAVIREITGRRSLALSVPIPLALFFARFTPPFYRLTRTRPIFTTYSIETVIGNSVISHAKAEQELGYTPRSLRESIMDTTHWFLENKAVWSRS